VIQCIQQDPNLQPSGYTATHDAADSTLNEIRLVLKPLGRGGRYDFPLRSANGDWRSHQKIKPPRGYSSVQTACGAARAKVSSGQLRRSLPGLRPKWTLAQLNHALRRDGEHGAGSVRTVLEDLVSGNHAHADVGNAGTSGQSPAKASRAGAKVCRDQMKGLPAIS
jgi:hypothetical protein